MDKKLRASSIEGLQNDTDTYTIESDKSSSALQKIRATAKGTWGSYFGTLQILKGIKARSEKEPFAVFDDLYSLLWREDFIFQAIDKLRTNKGTSTPGVDKNTFDKYNNEQVSGMVEKLKAKKYHFLPVKRIMIPKPGKSVKRPLGIPSFCDRIVQEMIRTILEQIYEPVFDKTHGNVNMGFRPGKGCHESVYRILQKVKGMEWCIEGDIKGAYDNIQHNKLISILSEKIKDSEFLKLIRNGLECGFELQGKHEHSLLGTPQGGIASPILFNIYLSKLDEYVAKDLNNVVRDKNQTEERKEKPVTKSYDKIRNETRKIQRKEKKGELETELKQRLKFLELNKFNVPYLDKKRATIRVVYARYADDWVLFTNGSQEFATQLRDKISSFLIEQLRLELSLEKTKITNIITSRVKFLGYSLSSFGTNRKIAKVADQSTNITAKRRTTGINLVAGIDQDRLDNRLMQKGFVTKDGTGGIKAKRKPEWTVFQDHEIIHKFNYVIRGLSNYYILINQVSHINWYCYLLYYSCAHTLANKHNTTLKKIFEKYGHPIEANDPEKEKRKKSGDPEANKVKLLDYNQIKDVINKQKIEFTKSLSKKELDNNSIDTDKNDPLDLRVNWRTAYRLAEHCCVCGSIEKVEMHHIKHVRKMGTKVTGFARIIERLNRKQIPTCRVCHERIHAGKYDDIALRDLYNINIMKI